MTRRVIVASLAAALLGLACGGASEGQPGRSDCSQPLAGTPSAGTASAGAISFSLMTDAVGTDLVLHGAAPDGGGVVKMPLMVDAAVGAVVSLTGAEITTGAPLIFEFGREPGRGSITFTVPNPIGQNPLGFIPGALRVEERGVYDVDVTMDGEPQGTVRFALCRDQFGY